MQEKIMAIVITKITAIERCSRRDERAAFCGRFVGGNEGYSV